MRFLSALCLLGVINAFYWGIKNQWMFEPATKRGGLWWLGDAAVGLACFILGDSRQGFVRLEPPGFRSHGRALNRQGFVRL